MKPPEKKGPHAFGAKQPTATPRHSGPPVAQSKTSSPAGAPRHPAAPPVYRPQAKPPVAQRKAAAPAPQTPPPAPPVYRPQPASKVMQAKKADGLRAPQSQITRQQPSGSRTIQKLDPVNPHLYNVRFLFEPAEDKKEEKKANPQLAADKKAFYTKSPADAAAYVATTAGAYLTDMKIGFKLTETYPYHDRRTDTHGYGGEYTATMNRGLEGARSVIHVHWDDAGTLQVGHFKDHYTRLGTGDRFPIAADKLDALGIRSLPVTEITKAGIFQLRKAVVV